ncbi:hypothetical protein FQZ97_1022420 [compost metagenome]
MFVGIYHQLRRHGWPVIAVKHGSAEKIYKPGPVGLAVVVGRHMETIPPPAIFHVPLEGLALGRVMHHVIQHHDQVVVAQFCFVHVGHSTGGVKHKTIADSEIPEKADGIVGKIYVRAFYLLIIESTYFTAGKLCQAFFWTHKCQGK